ncbi:MAG: AsmA-like C-terminal domain-containing protein, partial [Pseudomonadota bacterium]|nr:AsmA-like C-terminal domain-containing protein [Pseudomonadota bacterium]
YGSSIGITVEGALDLEEDIAELKGTVVPAYTVNRVLGQIPILGPILTGGENEGVFAASYAVNGPLEDPAIAVNPLSALAPGFLRKLFDAIGGDTEPSPSAAPEKQDN